jgi:hypothetical protein
MQGSVRVVAGEDVLIRTVGDELVLLDLQKGVYYGLNATGARIWELLASGLSIDETIACLESEHHASRESLTRDVVDLIEELRERDLIAADES